MSDLLYENKKFSFVATNNIRSSTFNRMYSVHARYFIVMNQVLCIK